MGTEKNNESKEIPEELFDFGFFMKKFSVWQWIVIIFFIISAILSGIATYLYLEVSDIFGYILWSVSSFIMLIISLVLLFFTIKFILVIKNLQEKSKDPYLEKIWKYQALALACQLCGITIATYILNILAFIELNKWSVEINDNLQTDDTELLVDGTNLLKIGYNLIICCGVGTFIIPVCFKKVGEAIMNEYENNKFGGIGKEKPYPIKEPEKIKIKPQTQSHTYKSELKFCPYCGAQIPNPDFCIQCGKKLI
ncbi:MAG: hypothetical protein ACTSWX_05790 [Promethearchaeota archaeon]